MSDINGISGFIATVANSDSSITVVAATTGPVTQYAVSINLGHTNNWSAWQEFHGGITFSGGCGVLYPGAPGGGSVGDRITIVTAPTANTSIESLVLLNSAAATSGNEQWSPRVRWTGFGYSAMGSHSREQDCIAELQVTGPTAGGG